MKITQFQDILRKKKVDFALIYNLDSLGHNPNFSYFTQYAGIGILIIPKSKQPFLLVPEMEYGRAKKSFKKTFKIKKKRLFEGVMERLRKNNIKTKKIAIDESSVTLRFNKALKKYFKNFKSVDISIDLLELRQIKDNNEINNTKKACRIADNIFNKTINNFKNFKTETHVAAFLEHETKKQGCDLSFPPIVASGKNASMPHHEPENTELKKGFCVIDYGIKYKGYCSDMTRTIYIGKPSEKEREIYNFILKVQEYTIKFTNKNNNCGKVYDFCVKSLKKYKDYFTHGLGHGVGVEIHELPNLTLSSKDKLKNTQHSQ